MPKSWLGVPRPDEEGGRRQHPGAIEVLLRALPGLRGEMLMPDWEARTKPVASKCQKSYLPYLEGEYCMRGLKGKTVLVTGGAGGIGGCTPVVLMQNTGFLESGDGFRGTITRMRVPLVCLITYRGYGKQGSLRLDGGDELQNALALSAAHLDAAALVTEPTLKAWGVPFGFLHGDDDLAGISAAFRKVAACEHP
jgi:hypothetical protein